MFTLFCNKVAGCEWDKNKTTYSRRLLLNIFESQALRWSHEASSQDNMRPVDLATVRGAKEAIDYLNALDAKAQASKIKQYQQWLS